MAENTFLGLQPYTEEDAYRFKGRAEESQELFRLIVRNDFTVCYAESGEGKTSLLNAGVFPLLRENMYFPIAITFTSDDYKVTPDNFSTIIDRCIKDSITEYNEKNKGINVEYRLCSSDFLGLDCQTELQRELSRYSWWKLRNYRPQAMGLTFTPVFVFDQFEEVFNMPGSIVWTKKFFDWLEEVSSDSCPDEIAKKVRAIIGTNAAFPAIKEEKDFKAVFSLRKEFIGELDYWGMQTHFIPALKDNRYCLKPLTYKGAKKVMTQQELFEADKVEQVLTYFVRQYSREPEKTIEENLPVIPALLLSVVGDSWEKDIETFSALSVEEVGKSLNMILERFYDQAINGIVQDLSKQNSNINPEQCRYDLETALFALVDSNSKRVRTKTTASGLTQIDFDRQYKRSLSDHRIIKVAKVDGEDYVEIVHDSLCPIVARRRDERLAAENKEREERLLKEQSRKMKRRISFWGVFVIAVFALGAILFSMQRGKSQEREAKEMYKLQRDSIQELQSSVEEKNKKLREDSVLLASHLLHFQNDSLLLADKNDSLQQQIVINLQKDKTIERLEALSKMTIGNNVAGKLSNRIEPNLKYLLTNLSISGQLNGTDIALLREMIINGSLKYLDLENAQIVQGGDAYYENCTIENDNVIEIRLFEGCSRLLHITLPNSVTRIGYSAFYGCSGLTSINIPSSVKSIGNSAFYGCSGLTSINIPESVTKIGAAAFYQCSGLTSINIPNSVTSIENEDFYGCSGLTSINIPESVTSIGISAFYDCSRLTSINIPNSVTKIGGNAFWNCSGLTSINIPESVTSIEYSAFRNCIGLTSINIPESVTSIESFAFSRCSGLTSINIPNSVTSIGDEAFSRCSGLTSINIPESVTSIGNHAFSYCSGLTSINIPESVKSIGSGAFASCSRLTSINIPNSVTSIGSGAFASCSRLTSINIPNSVTTIGRSAFSSCSSLTSINIPESVTSIGEEAFLSCSSLTSITLPNSVTSIGKYAFSSSGVIQIKSHIKGIETLKAGDHAFGHHDDITWIVPAGIRGDENMYVKKYKAQPWWNEKWKIVHE